MTDRKGEVVAPRFDRAVLESAGPVRATVRLEAPAVGRSGCRMALRLDFFAGTTLVRVRLTLHNPARAGHPGGIWDLGDPGSIFFRAETAREIGTCVKR
jgi:hypothetical protein